MITCSLGVKSCQKQRVIKVTNPINIDRSHETLELSTSFLKSERLDTIGIMDIHSKEVMLTQLVDNDGDGADDLLLFQTDIKANETQFFAIVPKKEMDEPLRCYSRFVPERTDDYAWENDRVCFRIYGPNAQYRFENNLKEGTLSSGIDAWLKRVDYPIIDNWYKKYIDKTGSYHEDTGEGLDNFHVGKSRGVGGLAHHVRNTYHVSKNYTKHKTITNGPIRASFYVTYDTWGDEKNIKESKIISLDYGSNLSKITVAIQGVDTVSAGLTLHDKTGEITTKEGGTWVSYWKPHHDSVLGTALVTTNDYFAQSETYFSDEQDLSHVFLNLKTKKNKVVYYAGFTWGKSGQFNSKTEWEYYLNDFTKRISNPLQLEILH